MYNESEKNKVNVDELVDFLIKRREGNMAEAASVPTPVQTETVKDEVELVPEVREVSAAPIKKVEAAPEEPVQPIIVPEEKKEQILNEVEEKSLSDAPQEEKKKRFSLFGRRNRRVAEEEDWDDWGLKPLGSRQEDEPAMLAQTPEAEAASLIPQPLDMDELPAVKAVAETITMQVVLPSGEAVPKADPATRIIPSVEDKEISSAKEATTSATVAVNAEPDEEDEQLPDQLSMEEMVRVEDIDPAIDEDASEEEVDPQTRLQRSREEKVREFVLGGGEEEPNEPEEEVVNKEEEDPEPEDFTGYQDTKTVAAELHDRQRSALLTLLFTGLLELALLLLTLLTEISKALPISGVAYLIIHAFSLALMMGINYAAIGRGLSGLFTLRANSDTAPALASSIAFLSVIIHFANTMDALPYWTPLAGLLLVFSAAGYYARAVGVRRNFSFVSYPGEKYAATLIEEDNAVQEIGRRASGAAESDAKVGYFHRTGFLSDYLANAYEDHRGDDWSRWMTPIAFGLSLVLSFASLLGEGTANFWEWLSVFVGMLCVSMQATHLAVQLPLNQCSRVMLSRGGFLVGWKAVRQFGELDALVVDLADLYPDESMLLHGIKTFSGTHIDDAILTAASLVVRAGGPLSKIFRRIIENKEELLHDVDSLVYEQGMGLSGWVDGRRVFVGNRRLLQNHGVDVPSSDYEARYAKDGRRLVYLSVAGQLSAMYVVSYLPNPEIQDALQDLCRSRITLLVRSCDPNITTVELCSDFALDEYYVDVLPAAAGRAYMQLAERASDSMPAVMASNGHILGTAWSLSVCRSLRTKSLMALAVQGMASAIGLILCLLWALNNQLSIFQPLLFMLGTSFLTWIAPLFKRT